MSTYSSTPTPPALVDSLGRTQFGVYQAPFVSPNLADARLRWGGRQLPRVLSNLRLKRWQHFALILPDAFLGLAIVDLGYLKTTWCSFVDRRSGAHFEHRRMGPHLKAQIANALFRDRTAINAQGYSIECENLLADGAHRLNFNIAAKGKRAQVSGQLECEYDLAQTKPLVVALPVGKGSAMYSHKAALPLRGSLQVGGRTFVADGESAFALIDVHKAHYPRHTWWNWATFAGRDAKGRLVAVNLTRNVNRNDGQLNENAVWLGNQLVHLGAAHFDFDPKDVLKPWRLSTADGAVSLEFTAMGERRENVKLGVIRSVFRQPYGHFSGTLKVAGETIEVDRHFGVCEDHDSLW
jgi:hypothetical protein